LPEPVSEIGSKGLENSKKEKTEMFLCRDFLRRRAVCAFDHALNICCNAAGSARMPASGVNLGPRGSGGVGELVDQRVRYNCVKHDKAGDF
jgi:hypothetical protein